MYNIPCSSYLEGVSFIIFVGKRSYLKGIRIVGKLKHEVLVLGIPIDYR